MAEKKKSNAGRPSKYRDEFAEQARKLCLLGATDPEIAAFFEVHVDTISEWKNVHEQFSAAIKSGKEQADANVADRLYQRAMGYVHPDVHISNYQGDVTITPIEKHYAPDPAAAIFWLKNRQRAKWRDKIDTEHTGTMRVVSATELKDDELAAIASSGGA
jgi:hypothetical protein